MEILKSDNSFLITALKNIVSEELNVTVNTINFIAGGSNGKVFKAETSDGSVLALKAYREQGNQLREAAQLRILSANTAVPMPEVVFTHADTETAVLAMSFIDGHNVLNPAFLLKSKAQKQKFAADVINGMSMWHELSSKKFGALDNPQYGTWLEYYIKEKQEPWLKALEALNKKGKFSSKRLDLLYRASELFERVYTEPKKAVLIHGDLNIMNIMAGIKTLELNGFIDPMGSMWADREYDLFQLMNMWGNSFYLYETYKSKHSLPKESDFRVAYYGAMNEASCRLGSGIHIPVWEELCIMRLEKQMKIF